MSRIGYRHSAAPSQISSAAPSRQVSLDRLFMNIEGRENPMGKKPPAGYCSMLMNHIKGTIGPGIFAIGEALKNSGIALGPPCLFMVAVLMVHCQHLLLESASRVAFIHDFRAKPDYAETVMVCFMDGMERFRNMAPAMKKITNFFLVFTQVGFCCIYFVFIADSINRILEYYYHPLNIHIVIAAIFIPLWLLTMISSLKGLTPIALLANLATLVGIGITLYYCSIDIPPISNLPLVGKLQQIPLFFGTCIFIFESIGMIVPMYNEMRDPNDFIGWCGVLNVGSAIVVIGYFSVGFMSYIKYQDEIKSSTTLNLPVDEMLAHSVVILIAAEVMITYVFQMYMAFMILFPKVYKKWGPFDHPRLAILLFKTFLSLVAFSLSEAIPFLGLFISLIGGLGGGFLAVILPPAIHLITFGEEMHICEIMKDFVILIFGFCSTIIVTYCAVLAIAQQFLHQFDST